MLAVAFSADGAVLYSTGKDRAILVWDAKRGWNLRHTYSEAHADWITCLAVSPGLRCQMTCQHISLCRLQTASML